MPLALSTYNDGKNIYSVDMMFAYINTKGHSVVTLPIETLLPQLEENVWGDWSPMNVLGKMDMAKYSENVDRIKKADLSYPIIVTGRQTAFTRTNTIIDGYHRIAKAYLDGKKTINAYIFDSTLMKKFILDKDLNFVKVHQQINLYEILELWSKKFC